MIKKIILTGGPCGGKSSSISKIKRKFEEKGYTVLVLSETATELIESGIKPFGENKINIYDFQKYVLSLQLHKEELIDNYINQNKDKDILVLYDRSIIDNKSYVSDEEFYRLLEEFNITESELYYRYDMAIHLLTAAKGTDFYTLENNEARSESKEDAIIQDTKTLNCYLGFPHHIIIDNSTNFEDKINRVVNEIEQNIKGKITKIKQRKYLVDEVDNEFLEQKARKLIITQNYLNGKNKDIMVRKVDYENSSSYYVSVKVNTNIPSEKIVTERIISEREYLDLISNRTDLIQKERYCFENDNIVYRLDKFENGLMLLEIEGYSDNITIPNSIKISKEVTNDPNYTNKQIARGLNNKKYSYNLK